MNLGVKSRPASDMSEVCDMIQKSAAALGATRAMEPTHRDEHTAAALFSQPSIAGAVCSTIYRWIWQAAVQRASGSWWRLCPWYSHDLGQVAPKSRKNRDPWIGF